MSLKSGKERERERAGKRKRKIESSFFFLVCSVYFFGNEMKVKKCVMTTKGTIDFQCVSPKVLGGIMAALSEEEEEEHFCRRGGGGGGVFFLSSSSKTTRGASVFVKLSLCLSLSLSLSQVRR